MAILISQLASTGAYTLTSDDATNRFIGLSTVAETLNFSGTGNLEILDVSHGDVLNLTDVNTSATINIKKSGNNVILTVTEGITTQIFTLGALADTETVTVNLGTGGRIPPLTISRTGDTFSYGDGEIVEGETPIPLMIASPTSLVEFNSTKLNDGILNDTEAANITIRATLASAAVAGDTVQLLSGTDVIKTSDALAGGETAVDFAIVKTDLGEDGDKILTAKITAGTNSSEASPALNFKLDTTAPTAPTAVTLTPEGGNVVTNTLNNTNTNLTAQATIVAGEATGGTAVLKVGGTLFATDSTIAEGDDTVTFTLAKTSTTELQAAITAGGSVTVELTDLAGNTSISTASNPTLVVDYTPTTLTVNGVALSADTGSSAIDFITNTAVQTVTATLSGALADTDVLSGSVDGGTNWIDITNKVNTTEISWDGATLSAGANVIKLKIKDAQGNEKEVLNQPYTLDTTAPAAPTVSLKAANDTGTSNSDGISKDGTMTVEGFETTPTGATWQYWNFSESTPAWSTAQNLSTTTFTLPAGTYAVGDVKVRQIDNAGNVSAEGTNATQIVIDTTAPAAPTVAINQAFQGNVDFVTGVTLATDEKVWLAPAGTTVFAVTDGATITSSAATSATLKTPSEAGSYKLFHQDVAGNFSDGSTDTILVDKTAPTSTISGIAFIQKFGTDENVVRLTGANFNTILTGTEDSSTDVKGRLDFTKIVWKVNSTVDDDITLANSDIAAAYVKDATQLDIVLSSNNALYNSAKFLAADNVADKVVINTQFISDKAGNVGNASMGTDTPATVTVADTYKAELVKGINNPAIFVAKIELIAPSTKTADVFDNATFDGANLKITPTTNLTLTQVQDGQTITLTGLSKMSNIGDTNVITFASATGATTGKVVIDLTGVSGVDLSNADATSADITLTGGSSYITLGTGTYSVTLKTTAVAEPNSNMFNVLDTVDSFDPAKGTVNFKSGENFSALGSTPRQLSTDDPMKIYSGDDATSAAGKNIWLMTDGTIAYDNDGNWGTYDPDTATFNGGTGANSVALVSIPNVTAGDLFLIA